MAAFLAEALAKERAGTVIATRTRRTATTTRISITVKGDDAGLGIWDLRFESGGAFFGPCGWSQGISGRRR